MSLTHAHQNNSEKALGIAVRPLLTSLIQMLTKYWILQLTVSLLTEMALLLITYLQHRNNFITYTPNGKFLLECLNIHSRPHTSQWVTSLLV